jgi:hypothetical protein
MPGSVDMPPAVVDAAAANSLGSAVLTAKDSVGIRVFWLVISAPLGLGALAYAVYGLARWAVGATDRSSLFIVGILGILVSGIVLMVRENLGAILKRSALYLFENGLVHTVGGTIEVIAWGDLDDWQPGAAQRGALVQTYRLLLRRRDGYELLIGEDARDKGETGAKNVVVLNRGRAFGQAVVQQLIKAGARGDTTWERLMAGESLSYGQLSLSGSGLHLWDGKTLAFGQIDWVGVKDDAVAVHFTGAKDVSVLPLAEADVPNLTDLTVNANRLATLVLHGNRTIGTKDS